MTSARCERIIPETAVQTLIGKYDSINLNKSRSTFDVSEPRT